MRIGILTSGGDTPGMNSVIRAAFIQCQNLNHELIGFKHGWKGLINNITQEIPIDIIDQKDQGGTLLGSARFNPLNITDHMSKIKNTLENNNIDCIIAIGGDDTLGVANALHQNNIPIIGVPKTIDNDLESTDYTFGFNSAVTTATNAIDQLKSTAKSHERIIVVQIMGRYSGWITLHSGIAGNAHVILIPEYPLKLNEIYHLIQRRYNDKNKWAIIVVSEAYEIPDDEKSNHNITQEKDEYGHIQLEKLEIAKKIATKIKQDLGFDTRSVTLGHTQRGGSPSSFDRVLSTQFGLFAIKLAHESKFGTMTSLKGSKIISVKLKDAISKLKKVDLESWAQAKEIMMI